jgi:integrase
MSAALRLYNADDSPRALTLEKLFEQHIAPELIAGKALTKLRQYRNSIAHFTAFLRDGTNTNSIRGAGEITDLDAINWQQWELSQGLKPATINVHWTRIRSVIRRAGPREHGNPRGLGLIANTLPYLKPLTTPRPRPKVISLAVIDALYRFGAIDMDWPSDGIPAVMRWRAWLVCSYNLAMRTRDLLGLRWDNIHTEPASLDPSSDNLSPFGWVEWIPTKTKHSKPDPLVMPLSSVVSSHLESIRSDSPFVFGRQMATVSNHRLYGREARPNSGFWPRLIAIASTYVDGGIRPFPIRAIRATANTFYNRLDSKLGSHVLGHAPRGTNDVFYQSWEAELIQFVEHLEQPPSFKRRPKSTITRQTLFF